MVVGVDRRLDVRVAAGRSQVAGGGEDRVGGVVRVLEAVAVGVDAVLGPLGGQELHPALGAGAGDAEVAPVVGLDLVDRREHLPGDPVGGAGRLEDRQQERRDLEAFDEEARAGRRSRPAATNGSAGVSVEGDGAGSLGAHARRGELFARACSPAGGRCLRLRVRGLGRGPLGLVPCARWACTCGGAASVPAPALRRRFGARRARRLGWRFASRRACSALPRWLTCGRGAPVVLVGFGREARGRHAQRERASSASDEQQARDCRSSGHRVIRSRAGS